jgi:tetratricopeptide (TPR) repeat protein
MASTLPNTRAE